MSSPFPPRCAEKFRAARLLSSGGFGAVYEAVQVALDRTVVVKLLHAELLEEKDELTRFLDEARISATLSHPSIVTLLDHDVENGRPWIAYELVEGRDLRAALADGPLPVDRAVEIAVQICGALAEAHAHGVVHRDLKPENVLDARNGLFKVTDFGAARWSGQAHHTRTGVVLGTPAYLAPEQVSGEVTARSDLYALGCLLYELLAGRPPFFAENPLMLLQMQVQVPAPPVRERRPEVPAHVERAILRAMSKDPAERFATAAEMAEALKGAEAQPRSARSTADTLRVERKPAARGSAPVAAVRPARPATWMLVAGGVAALAALALAPRQKPVVVTSPTVAPSGGAELGEVERARVVAQLDALAANRRKMIPEFQETWAPNLETPPQKMHAKAIELTASVSAVQREAEAVILAMERENTPWRRVLRARARAERCLRVLQLGRLRAVEPEMRKMTDAIEKAKLMEWLQRFTPSRVEVLEMDAMLRDAGEAFRLMERHPELARELGYLLDSLLAVAGQCAVLIGKHRTDMKARMDRTLGEVLEQASPAMRPMALLLERVWGSVYLHGNAYAAYHAALAAEARALVGRMPAAGPGIEHLLQIMAPR